MPLYDFECDCGYEDTSIDEMHGDSVRECPRCKRITLYRLIGTGGGVNFSTGLKDKSGESIWWPKDKQEYYDPVLRRRFSSPEDKKKFMDDNNIILNGSMDSDNYKLKKKLEMYKEEEKVKQAKKKKNLVVSGN